MPHTILTAVAADPTISKTFFDHFDCRRLSPVESILNVDNSVVCNDSTWSAFAVIAVLGLATISFGAPLYLLIAMARAMRAKLKEVRHGHKKKIVALNEFGAAFDYVAGNFKAEA